MRTKRDTIDEKIQKFIFAPLYTEVILFFRIPEQTSSFSILKMTTMLCFRKNRRLHYIYVTVGLFAWIALHCDAAIAKRNIEVNCNYRTFLLRIFINYTKLK